MPDNEITIGFVLDQTLIKYWSKINNVLFYGYMWS